MRFTDKAMLSLMEKFLEWSKELAIRGYKGSDEYEDYHLTKGFILKYLRKKRSGKRLRKIRASPNKAKIRVQFEPSNQSNKTE